jgi:hypothetical protein
MSPRSVLSWGVPDNGETRHGKDEPERALFLAQRLERIDLSRPAGRDVTGEQGDRCQ